MLFWGRKDGRRMMIAIRAAFSGLVARADFSLTLLNSAENYGHRCLTPLSLHRYNLTIVNGHYHFMTRVARSAVKNRTFCPSPSPIRQWKSQRKTGAVHHCGANVTVIWKNMHSEAVVIFAISSRFVIMKPHCYSTLHAFCCNIFLNKYLAVVEMGDHLATIDMGRKLRGCIPFGRGSWIPM